MAARWSTTKSACGWCSSRRGQRFGVPAANTDSFSVHPCARGFGLLAESGLHARSINGNSRAFRPLIYTASVEFRVCGSRHHVYTKHRELARSTDYHHDCAADDVLGETAGLCANHRCIYSPEDRLGFFESPRGGALCALSCWYCKRHGSSVDHEGGGRTQDDAPLDDGTTLVSVAASEKP